MTRFVFFITILLAFMACSSTVNLSNQEIDLPEPQNAEVSTAIEQRDILAEEPKEYSRSAELKQTEVSPLFETKGGIVPSEIIKKKLASAEKLVVTTKDKDMKNSTYTLQFEVVSDVDDAQKRRWAVSNKTGLGAYILFDSPFYKIRAGKWTNREEAEDASLQFNAMGMAAILIEL